MFSSLRFPTLPTRNQLHEREPSLQPPARHLPHEPYSAGLFFPISHRRSLPQLSLPSMPPLHASSLCLLSMPPSSLNIHSRCYGYRQWNFSWCVEEASTWMWRLALSFFKQCSPNDTNRIVTCCSDLPFAVESVFAYAYETKNEPCIP